MSDEEPTSQSEEEMSGRDPGTPGRAERTAMPSIETSSSAYTSREYPTEAPASALPTVNTQGCSSPSLGTSEVSALPQNSLCNAAPSSSSSDTTPHLNSSVVEQSCVPSIPSTNQEASNGDLSCGIPNAPSPEGSDAPPTEATHSTSEEAKSPNPSGSSRAKALVAGSRSEVPPPKAPRLNATAQDFVLLKVLGTGSYSKVVLARYKGDGCEYALKVMAKQLIVRERKVKGVKRERLILDQLDHPGIVRMRFTFQDAASLYMGMECCHGGDLFDQIRLRGRMPLSVARFYAAEAVCILEYLRGCGVLHRDLKPENLLLTAEGHLKLADFGSACLALPAELPQRTPVVGDSSESEALVPCGRVQLPPESETDDERNGSFVGTAEYISPEALNSEPCSFESDLWALGCIIFHMLEGRPPFRGASEYLTFQKVLSRDFAFKEASTDENARDVIEKLLQTQPSKRLGSEAQGGFGPLKVHPFFSGIEWGECLWNQDAPPIAKRKGSGVGSEMAAGDSGDEASEDEDEGEEEDDDEEDSSEDEEWQMLHLGSSLMQMKC